MTILGLILFACLIVVLGWAVRTLVEHAQTRQVLQVMLLVILVLVILSAFGVLPFLNQPVPRLGVR